MEELQEKITSLTAQCAQLDQTNRAWQSYQQAQLDNLRNKLMHHIPVDENMSLDEIAQQLVDHITKEQQDVDERFQEIERANDELRSGRFLDFSSLITCLVFSYRICE